MRLGYVLILLLAFLWSAEFCRAELARVEIVDRKPFVDGRRFGGAGGYELLIGKAHFTLDPELPANHGVIDLRLAPRNPKGLVEVTADMVLFRPQEPDDANGTVLFEASNRGGTSLVAMFNQGGLRDGWNSPRNGYLMNEGYTLAWLGWQFDAPADANLRLVAPVAHHDGATLHGNVRWQYVGQPAAALSLTADGGYCVAERGPGFCPPVFAYPH